MEQERLPHEMSFDERFREIKRLKALPTDFANRDNIYNKAGENLNSRKIEILELWQTREFGVCQVCQLLGRINVPLLPEPSYARTKNGYLSCAHPECGLVYQAKGARGK